MNFALNETEKMIQDTARKFLTANAEQTVIMEKMVPDPVVNRGKGQISQDDRLKWQKDFWKNAVDLGWMEMALPDSMGGVESTAVERGVVLEEIGAALAPLPYLETVFVILPQLTKGGRSAEAEAVANGQRILMPAIHENEPAWNPADIRMEARRSGKNYILKGTKHFVPYPELADSWIVAARTGPTEDGWSSVSTFIVEKNQPGIRWSTEASFDPIRPMGSLVVEDLEIPESCRIGEEGEGGLWLSQSIPITVAAACIEMLGGARRVLDLSVEYACERIQYGKHIGSYQAVQRHLVDMFVAVESMRSAAYYALATIDLAAEDKEQALKSFIAKAYCGPAYRQLVESGIQVYGGNGFTWEYPLHVYYRRALALEAMFGKSTHYERLIAQVLRDSHSIS